MDIAEQYHYLINKLATGSAEFTKASDNKGDISDEEHKHLKNVTLNTQSCSNCLAETHQDGAEFCHQCGHKLHP
jgi:voltage-gated potassium channel